MLYTNVSYAITIVLNFLIFNSPGAKLSCKAQDPKRTPTLLRKILQEQIIYHFEMDDKIGLEWQTQEIITH